jgi:hypothetical protein
MTLNELSEVDSSFPMRLDGPADLCSVNHPQTVRVSSKVAESGLVAKGLLSEIHYQPYRGLGVFTRDLYWN